jgi:pyridoxamine 5'-phosphate oxidase
LADLSPDEISSLRKNYTKAGLEEEDLSDEPVKLFEQWLNEALESDVLEPNAMVLSTVDKNGYSNSRTVLLKGIGKDSIRFFTNYESVKGTEIFRNANVSVVFWWGELERQVRIRGVAEKITEKESTRYFQSRPRESQLGAWASNQSQEISGRDALENRFNEVKEKYSGRKIPKPPTWGGFDIAIHEIEFWQGRPGRLHDRIKFSKENSIWQRKRLAP